MNSHTSTPDIENIACYLLTTATLAQILTDKYLQYNTQSVRTDAALGLLAGGRSNNGETGNAYDVIRSYGMISDTVVIIEERIREAARLLDELATISLTHERGIAYR